MFIFVFISHSPSHLMFRDSHVLPHKDLKQKKRQSRQSLSNILNVLSFHLTNKHTDMNEINILRLQLESFYDSYIPAFDSNSLRREIWNLCELTFELSLTCPNRILRCGISIHQNYSCLQSMATSSLTGPLFFVSREEIRHGHHPGREKVPGCNIRLLLSQPRKRAGLGITW